ncbi:zinc finger, CCHC-type containing protein [Tanacetum coccineum]
MWDEMAKHFDQADIQNMEQPVIIAVSSCRVSMYIATYYYLNPKIPEVKESRAVFKSRHQPSPPLIICKVPYQDVEQEKTRNRFTLKTIMEQNPQSDKQQLLALIQTKLGTTSHVINVAWQQQFKETATIVWITAPNMSPSSDLTLDAVFDIKTPDESAGSSEQEPAEGTTSTPVAITQSMERQPQARKEKNRSTTEEEEATSSPIDNATKDSNKTEEETEKMHTKIAKRPLFSQQPVEAKKKRETESYITISTSTKKKKRERALIAISTGGRIHREKRKASDRRPHKRLHRRVDLTQRKKEAQIKREEEKRVISNPTRNMTKDKDGGDTSKKEVGTISAPQFQCPMLKPTNYSLWAIRMQIILEANGLWEMIEPSETTKSDNKKDKTAIAFLYQSLPEEQLLQITKHKTAKAIWNALKTRHIGEERVQQARLQTLKSDFEMLHMKEDETIDAFTTKLTTLVNKAASLGHTMEDETLVRKLLNAVPDRYLQIVASIEQYSDLSEMTLEEAIGRLKTYEERIKYKGKQVDNQDRLLFTRYEEQGRRRGHGGSNQSQGQESNFKKETHNNSNKLTHDKSKIMCFKCKEYGHYANRCPLKKEEQSNLIEEDLQPQLLMAIIEESRIWNGRKFHSTST